MTALQKLEAALREHARKLAFDRIRQREIQDKAAKAWRDEQHALGFDEDGWSYETKERWLREARAAREAGK